MNDGRDDQADGVGFLLLRLECQNIRAIIDLFRVCLIKLLGFKLISGWSFSALETVETETPRFRAISFMVRGVGFVMVQV
jgi:hypothetical protein